MAGTQKGIQIIRQIERKEDREKDRQRERNIYVNRTKDKYNDIKSKEMHIVRKMDSRQKDKKVGIKRERNPGR